MKQINRKISSLLWLNNMWIGWICMGQWSSTHLVGILVKRKSLILLAWANLLFMIPLSRRIYVKRISKTEFKVCIKLLFYRFVNLDCLDNSIIEYDDYSSSNTKWKCLLDRILYWTVIKRHHDNIDILIS